VDSFQPMPCFTLKHTDKRIDGVFGVLTDDYNGLRMAYTLEHAYPNGDPVNGYIQKIPPGVYLCVLGTHQLEHGSPVQLYMLLNVPGHDRCLLHNGDFNCDSDGCILLGESILKNTVWQLVNSVKTLGNFMAMNKGFVNIQLTVQG